VAELNESLHNAAAKPSREAPLSAIETRLRRRRKLRQGAVGVCAVALVGALSGGIALSVDSDPSIRTLPGAAAQVTGGDPLISVELPDGWVESPIESVLRIDHEIFTVGTAAQPTGVTHNLCIEDPEYQDDVFVMLREFTAVELAVDEAINRGLSQPIAGYGDERGVYGERPADFATGVHDEVRCSNLIFGFWFHDVGRFFVAQVSIGPSSSPDRLTEAYAVLNSLVVAPITFTPEPVPVTTVPPVTVPPSADTDAIETAFEGWIATAPPDFEGNEAFIADWAGIKATGQAAAQAVGNPDCYTGRVDAITRIDEDDADVIFTFLCNGQPASIVNQPGHAVKINGVWLVSRETVCDAFAVGGYQCPPRE
jgi:hypothetical protein